VKNERWQINEITGRKERKRIRFKEKKEGKGRSLHYFEKNIGVRRIAVKLRTKLLMFGVYLARKDLWGL
jgi:hypothetical protein